MPALSSSPNAMELRYEPYTCLMKADKVVIGCLGICLSIAVIVIGFFLSLFFGIIDILALILGGPGSGDAGGDFLALAYILAGIIITGMIGYMIYSHTRNNK